MKKQLFVLSVFAALTAATVYGQDFNKLKVDVPFSFHVGKATMPAGEYDVRTNSIAPGVLTLRSPDCKSAINIITIPAQAPQTHERGMLVFNHYKGEYFLSQVWNAGTNSGVALRKTRREVEIAKGEFKTEQTELYAKSR